MPAAPYKSSGAPPICPHLHVSTQKKNPLAAVSSSPLYSLPLALPAPSLISLALLSSKSTLPSAPPPLPLLLAHFLEHRRLDESRWRERSPLDTRIIVRRESVCKKERQRVCERQQARECVCEKETESVCKTTSEKDQELRHVPLCCFQIQTQTFGDDRRVLHSWP